MMPEVTDEMLLCFKLIQMDKAIPEKLKAKALEQLDIMMMEYEESDAMFYLLRQIHESILKESKDELDETLEIALYMTGRKVERYNDNAQKMIMLGAKAVDKFANEGDESAKRAMMIKLADEDLLPVFYDKSMMILVCSNGNFMVASINDTYAKDQLIDKFNEIPSDTKVEIIDAVYDVLHIKDSKVLFVKMNYKFIDGNKVSLELKEF